MNTTDPLKDFVVEKVKGSSILLAHKKIVTPAAESKLNIPTLIVPEYNEIFMHDYKYGGIEYERNPISQRCR